MKLGSIQILRALAAILVVYNHAINSVYLYTVGWLQTLPLASAMGVFGVDLFFVISGFVIYLSAGRLTGRSAASSFLWHRFRRINPIYYVATAITLLLWLPAILRGKHPQVTGKAILSSLILLRYPGSADPILLQAWSLSFEWYFYAIFCLLILLRVRKKAIALTALLGGMVLLGAVLHAPAGVLGFYTNPYIMEFLMGAGLGYCFSRWTPGKPASLTMLVMGILLALFWLATGYADVSATPWSGDPVYAYIHAGGWGSSAALIVAGCVFLEKAGADAFFRRRRFILLLGDASYSIYLFHLVVLGIIGAAWSHLGLVLPPRLVIHIHVILMIAGSLLFYKYAEAPLLRMLKKPPTPSPLPSTGNSR